MAILPQPGASTLQRVLEILTRLQGQGAKTTGKQKRVVRNMNIFGYCFLVILLLSGCSRERSESTKPMHCIDCHTMAEDPRHEQPCISCHQGKSPAADKDGAHAGLVAMPAHPDHMQNSCGSCHGETVAQLPGTLHFTLKNSTNLFRKSFGAKETLQSFLETPVADSPQTILGLGDDLLRRRCFRCHLFSPGDGYPLVSHGTGCAACHLSFEDGELQKHVFSPPSDEQCLSCHYGNYVGYDYYGRFEHDLNIEYRTPYTTKQKYFRPYGVEFHQLSADIHQIRGMLCIDCHTGTELMQPGGKKVTCESCHSYELLERSPPERIEKQQGVYTLRGRNGQQHRVVLMQHPAHFNQAEKIGCQACHAQWTYNDIGKHFMRIDSDDIDVLASLSVQGSLEVENIIEINSDFDKDEIPVQMTDKLTGEAKPGIWHKGYIMRRWETVILGRDDEGKIAPMRPMLDFYLSWVDADDNVRFDSVGSQSPNHGMMTYVPHTTGAAGIFYRERIEQFLQQEKDGAAPQTTSPLNAF
ncbi:MAG: hypothetical protein ACWGOX_09290 [Desulforhopalus sp.]